MNNEMRFQVEALLRAGHSDLAVHKETGADRGTVARHRKRLGLPGYQTTAGSPACRHGHPFPEYVARNEKGHLVCRGCINARARRRYLPAEPDVIAVERAVAGDPPARLTPRERHAAIQQLSRRQMTADIAAQCVRCSQRTVWRGRAAA